MQQDVQFSKVLFVVNPISGGKDKEELMNHINAARLKQSPEISYYETSGDNDHQKLAQKITSYAPDAVFAIGGDGTVHLAGVVLISENSDIPLGIIPFGSGNGLSKDLSIPQDPVAALDLISKHTIRSIDTLEINGKPCIHLADLGFNALIVKKFDQSDSRGPGAYVRIALAEYPAYKSQHYYIETDNGTFNGKAFMLTVTNANQFGSNATINPEGLLNDGMFEICIIEPFSVAAGVRILYQLYNETIHESDYSQVIRCKEATIENPSNQLAQIDGEIAELGETLNIRLKPKSLRVILPYTPENMV